MLDQLEAISVQLGHVTAALSRTETRLGVVTERLAHLEDLVGSLVARTEVSVATAERCFEEAREAHKLSEWYHETAQACTNEILSVREDLRKFRIAIPCQSPCQAQLTLVAEAE